ncbi:hypothetical protein BJY52DRAFT_1295471 [Lactarius psammicola]|nr:hypothetical protein BJY52DRAFT_1295471 [Lactarius psammicola]
MVNTMAHARATSSSPTERGGEGNGSQDRLTKLFSLPDGKPALFLLYDFDDTNLAERIAEHGGRVTDDEAFADVILTRSRDEYKSLKDRYAVSRKTHVRVSGFVDRCIYARRFVLVPIPGKGVPGRIPGARRTEFTEGDDEYLCQYIAEILPEKSEGGRTGHFIYTDLMRRAGQFGQYTWAQRHTKDAWRERYRKNQDRLDQRIAEIVEENPPAPDGRGRYKSRRFGKLDREETEGEEFVLDAEEDAGSATDNEDGPVLARKVSTRPQEEEEEDEEEHRPKAESSPRSQDSYLEEEEEGQEAQTAGRQQRAGPTLRIKASRGKRWPSHSKTPVSKRRKAATSRRREVPSLNDLDPTLPGPDGDDQVAQECGAPAEPETRMRVTRSQARPAARPNPFSPRRTRASSRLRSATLPELTPASTRRRAASRAKAMAATPSSRRAGGRVRSVSVEVAARTIMAMAKSSAATLETVLEPESHAAHDEFVVHSLDESEMQEVEVNLHADAGFRGGDRPVDSRARRLSADDLQTSKRLQRAGGAPSGAAGLDEDQDEKDEDEDTSDAELLARNLNGGESDEEVFPSSGTRAQAEKSRRTQWAKVAPYVPPPGTRAASMMEKGKGKARETALRRE